MKAVVNSLVFKFLVIGVLVAGFVIVGWYGLYRQQRQFSFDAVRKDDIQRLNHAINYYADEHDDCFPPERIVEQCGAGELQPWMREVPCDPVTGKPYDYEVDNSYCPKSFKLYAKLNRLDLESPEVRGYACLEGCGTNNQYNFGVTGRLTPHE
ncbi:hypothetical protein A2783_02635 [Microgenomates group bacterium RIFCSPHIGHO2_01_FULL_45_11]|nr:MAG: hypothetical protein A2783_02635 [Microgenomates group bacterium RIFCSPHIGHO2_01_FULL_45_11]